MLYDNTTTWRAVVGDESAFIDHIKSVMNSVLDWRASKTGQTYSTERAEIIGIPSTVQALLPWIVQKHKSLTGSLNIGKLWNSPEFPLYNVLHRFPSVSDRTPVNLVGSDIELWVLDGAADIGWVKRPIKAMFNGSISTKTYRGAPVMILCRHKHYTPSRGLNADETIENTAKLIKTLVLEYCAYSAIGDTEVQAQETTPFVNPIGQTPPSFLDQYVKQDVFTEFKTFQVGVNDNHAGNILRLQRKTEELDSRTEIVPDLSARLRATERNVSSLESHTNTHDTLIENLAGTTRQHSGKIGNLEQFTNVLNTNLTGVQQTIGVIQGEQAETDREIQNLKRAQLDPNQFVSKSEVAELKRLQEELGRVDITSFATRTQLAQQQQSIESWGNGRFELKGQAGNLINAARSEITQETNLKVDGLSKRINSATLETASLRASVRQNLDGLTATLSATDTRLTNGLTNAKTELQTAINNRMPKPQAADGMFMVADNTASDKWRASHFSQSIFNLIKDNEYGYVLNGAGRITDGTGKGSFAYTSLAFNGSSGSFAIPTQSSDVYFFFGERIRLKEKVFKISLDSRLARPGSSSFWLCIRWFNSDGQMMTNILRIAESIRLQVSSLKYWVVAPSDAAYCEIGVSPAKNAPQMHFANIRVQFANDIPEEILWKITPSETYRPAELGEDRLWLNMQITTHNFITVSGIIHNPAAVPTGRQMVADSSWPLQLSAAEFGINTPFGGFYLLDSKGLKLGATFPLSPAFGLRLGGSYITPVDSRTFDFSKIARAGSPVPFRPLMGLNNNGQTGY